MLRLSLIGTLLFLTTVSLRGAGDDEKLASGPKAGALVPAPFQSFIVNLPLETAEAKKGEKVKRHSCLVCRFAFSPTVLVFAREPAEGKDEALNELLKGLDEATAEFAYRNFSAAVVFLSPDARDSTNNVDQKESKELIKETVLREKLIERLDARAMPLKSVLVASHPAEGPKKYDLNPKADVTILFYDRMRVLDTWAFGPDAMKQEDVKAILDKVRKSLPLRTKVEDKKGDAK